VIGPARRIDHRIAGIAADQERMRAPGMPRVVAETPDVLRHQLWKDCAWRRRRVLGMDRGGRAEQPGAPGEDALFRIRRLMIEDRLPDTLDDEAGRDSLRRFAIDAIGIDVPIARSIRGVSCAHRRLLALTPRTVPAAPPSGRGQSAATA